MNCLYSRMREFEEWCEDNGGEFYVNREEQNCVWDEGLNQSKVSIGSMGAVMVRSGSHLDVKERQEVIRRPLDDDTDWEEVNFTTTTDRVGDPIASELDFDGTQMTVTNREKGDVIHEIKIDVL